MGTVITDKGIKIPTWDEALSENIDTYREKTGDIDVSPSSASGELCAIISEIDLRNQQNVANAFTQNSVTSATGNNLDNLAKLKNQDRLVDQKSVAYLKFTATADVNIPAGTQFKCNTNNEIFTLDFGIDIVFATNPIVFGSCSSVNIGVEAPSGTIDFVSPIANVSVINNSPAVVGSLSESDEDLRSRISTIGTPLTLNLKEGLYLALKNNIPNVKKVNILDNNTDTTISGVPPRYFSPVILGGNNSQIAKTIYDFTGIGNPSFGDVVETIKSEVTGDLYGVRFYRPLEILVAINVSLTVDSTFNQDSGKEEVKNNIVSYFDNLNISDNAYIQRIEALCLIDGVTNVSLTLNGGNVSIFADFKELLVTNLSNVVVTTI